MIYKLGKKMKGDFISKVIDAFFGQGSFVLLTILFSFICTRLFGVEVFGQYTYAFSLVTILMFIAKAGFDGSLVYYIPKTGSKFVSLSFLINLFNSFAIVLISFFFVQSSYVALALPLIWLVSMEKIFFGIYRATGRIKSFFFIYGFLSLIIRIVLSVVFYFVIGDVVYSIIVALYISYLFSISVYFVQNKQWFKKLHFDFKYFRYSLPLALSGLSVILINKVDILMIGNMLDKRSVGVYQIVVQLTNITGVILIIFNTVFAPKISRLFHNGKTTELKKLYAKSTKVLGIFSFILTLLIMVFSGFILSIFGEAFLNGQTALILRLIGQFVSLSVGASWILLSMTGNSKLPMYGNLAAVVINIVLNVLLIPRYGINGVAFASMISLILTNITGYFFVSQKFNIKVFRIV